MINYIVFFTIVGLIWYWWNSISAYEVAYKEAKKACQYMGLQFLDDTLDVIKFHLCRHPRGHMQICRVYEFEFSSNGNSRYKGFVSLSGLKYDSIDMEAYKIEVDELSD